MERKCKWERRQNFTGLAFGPFRGEKTGFRGGGGDGRGGRENQTFGFTGAGQLCYNEIHMGRRAAVTGLGGFRVRFQTAALRRTGHNEAAARAGIG